MQINVWASETWYMESTARRSPSHEGFLPRVSFLRVLELLLLFLFIQSSMWRWADSKSFAWALWISLPLFPTYFHWLAWGNWHVLSKEQCMWNWNFKLHKAHPITECVASLIFTIATWKASDDYSSLRWNLKTVKPRVLWKKMMLIFFHLTGCYYLKQNTLTPRLWQEYCWKPVPPSLIH